MADWKYVVEFSCGVEHLKKLDPSRILRCVFHPRVPGDALVRMEVAKEEIPSLSFKTYHDNMEQSMLCHGGLHIWKVRDTSSFQGKNLLQEIVDEYHC